MIIQLKEWLAPLKWLLGSGTAKTSLADNDTFAIADSAASSALKKVAFSVLKSQILGDTEALLYKGATD